MTFSSVGFRAKLAQSSSPISSFMDCCAVAVLMRHWPHTVCLSSAKVQLKFGKSVCKRLVFYKYRLQFLKKIASFILQCIALVSFLSLW